MTLELFKMQNKYKLPEKYKGKTTKNTGLTINNPRKWTNEEIKWLEMLQSKNLTIKQIAECLDRDLNSVSIKCKRLKKKSGITYNEKHRFDKYMSNQEYLNMINPKSVLDVYSGEKSYYLSKVNKVITNDINKSFNTNYNVDALKLLCMMYAKNKKFDIVDLDPFGSAYECFDLAIKIMKKGLIITFGEMGHKRWKRLDFVQSRYNINTLENFEIDNLIKKVIEISKRNKKNIKPVIIKNWKNISRVYFIKEK